MTLAFFAAKLARCAAVRRSSVFDTLFESHQDANLSMSSLPILPALLQSSGSKCATVGIDEGAGAEAPAPSRRHTLSFEVRRSFLIPASTHRMFAAASSSSLRIRWGISSGGWSCSLAEAQSAFQRIGQGRAGDLVAESHVTELALHRAQAGLDVAEALPECQLRESQTKKLVEAGKASEFVIAAVPLDALLELVGWKVIHQLRKDQTANVHALLSNPAVGGLHPGRGRWRKFKSKNPEGQLGH